MNVSCVIIIGLSFISLIIGFTEDPEIETWKGYFYALLMFLATLLMSILLGQYSIKMYIVGAKMRTGITTAVYKKVSLVCIQKS